jgi:hypothetical protein
MTQSPQSLSERLLVAAKGSDWRGVFELSEVVFNDADDPDDVFLSAWTELSGDAADTFLEVARDAGGRPFRDPDDRLQHLLREGIRSA